MTLQELIDAECNRVFEEACARRGLKMSDVLGRSTKQELIMARRDTILALAGSGFRHADIARVLRCHHGTVKYWVDEETRDRRRNQMEAYANKRRGNVREFLRNMEATTANAKASTHSFLEGPHCA